MATQTITRATPAPPDTPQARAFQRLLERRRKAPPPDMTAEEIAAVVSAARKAAREERDARSR